MIKQVDNPAIEVHSLTVGYDQKPVLWNVDFTIPTGEISGIIGPNGSGKTTLLKSMMGLLPINSGYIKIFDQELKKVRTRVAYVPQRETVDWDFPANVMDITLMGRYRKNNLFKRLTKEDKTLAIEALKKVGMLDFADRQISQLSGGQQQRVFIARALTQGADLFIMDEPFAGVDAASEDAILKLFATMKEAGKTVVVVHHDLQTAKQYFDWMVLLNTRLVASGPTKEVFTDTLLQETYGGKLNILSRVAHLMESKEFPMREKQ
jgi:manganese/zinc/iron transport system ATP- binding protein